MATYVLVHGLSGRLDLEAGRRTPANGRHQVHTPTLDGCAERHHLARRASRWSRTPRNRAVPVLRGPRARGARRNELRGMVICKAAELARDRIGGSSSSTRWR